MTQTPDSIADDSTLLRRAFAAYYRSAHHEGHTDQQINAPSSDSFVTEHAGKLYVVLVNVNGVLAVYRVRNDGILKGLRRWPKELEEC